jgi:hypothetical protein
MRNSGLSWRARRSLLLAPAALLASYTTPVAALTNGSGDGQVDITLNGSGTSTAAYFNPMGALPTGDTTYLSNAYLRIGDSGARTALTNQPSTIVSSGPNEMVSTFSLGALNFTLTQTLSDLFNTSGERIGSVLTQAYGFTNSGANALDFSLARYIDGEMTFGGTSRNIAGGGSAMIDGTTQAVFETLKAVGLEEETIFLGITSEGGTALGYEVDYYGTVNNHVASGSALGNFVAKDLDGDGLVDVGQGYDVALAMESGFRLAGGAQGQWVTRTLFGSGSLGSVTFDRPATGAVPEPGTWAMMIAGLGIVGAAMRRRPTSIAFA